jgi:hypothetical protein
MQVLLQPGFLEDLTGLAQLHREAAAAVSEMSLLDSDDCGDMAGDSRDTAEGRDSKGKAGSQDLLIGDDSDWTEL